jgi:hypothetical protein
VGGSKSNSGAAESGGKFQTWPQTKLEQQSNRLSRSSTQRLSYALQASVLVGHDTGAHFFRAVCSSSGHESRSRCGWKSCWPSGWGCDGQVCIADICWCRSGLGSMNSGRGRMRYRWRECGHWNEARRMRPVKNRISPTVLLLEPQAKLATSPGAHPPPYTCPACEKSSFDPKPINSQPAQAPCVHPLTCGNPGSLFPSESNVYCRWHRTDRNWRAAHCSHIRACRHHGLTCSFLACKNATGHLLYLNRSILLRPKNHRAILEISTICKVTSARP